MRLARNAYRRPASEEELELLLRVFDLAQENKLDYSASLSLMLKAVLVSPQFLFITPAKELKVGQTVVPLDDYQLASRLSYLLWATMPMRNYPRWPMQGNFMNGQFFWRRRSGCWKIPNRGRCSMASARSGWG